MSGLLLLGVVLLWLVTAISFAVIAAKFLASILKRSWIKSVVGLLLVAVLIPLPLVDEIIGGIQFRKLCDKYAVQYIDEKNATNRKVFYVPRGEDLYAEGTAVHIQINPEVYKDVETKKVLVSSHTLIATGGWLIRALGISETDSPLLFNRGCSPPNPDEFKKKFNITVIN